MLLSPQDFTALRRCIRTQALPIKADARIIFTCGAQSDGSTPTKRDQVLEYARKHLPQYHFFKAETFFEALSLRSKDLLSLEKDLAEYSDCILLILESDGAKAELGAFSLADDLAEIVLAVNDRQFRHSKSFISEGPLAKIEHVSKFGKTLFADFNSILLSMDDIGNRLKRISKYNAQVDVSTLDRYLALPRKTRMMILADLVSLVSPASYVEIIEFLKGIFGEHKPEINNDLALLTALGFVKKHFRYFYTTSPGVTQFVDLKIQEAMRVRASTLCTYWRRDRQRLQVLHERLKVTDELN